MGHLNPETLARLVDEPPDDVERSHLRSCARCASELRALREQTEALSDLPEIRPPRDGWKELESRLRAEGLIARERTAPGKPRRASRRVRRARSGGLRAAAALLVFLAGTAAGAVARGSLGPGGEATGPAIESRTRAAEAGSVEEAAEALRAAQEEYVSAVVRYRQLVERADDQQAPADDPASRFAALETLVAASRAAVREAPADPFVNGVLAGTMAERQAVLQRLVGSAEDDEWF